MLLFSKHNVRMCHAGTSRIILGYCLVIYPHANPTETKTNP